MIQLTRKIYCCKCQDEIIARQTNGLEVYPHRLDLQDKKFFICDICLQFVGCHKNSGEPLGVIPTKEFKEIRKQIHALIDPLWKNNNSDRTAVYKAMTTLMKLDRTYHTADLKTKEEHDCALKVAQLLSKAN